MKTKKPRYVRQYTSFLWKMMYAANGPALLFLAVLLLAQTLLPTISIYLPKVVLQGLEESWSLQKMVYVVGGMTLVMMLVTILEKRMTGKKITLVQKAKKRFMVEINRKSGDMDYHLYEHPDTRNGQAMCREIYEYSFPKMIDSFLTLVNYVLGFLVYGTLLITLSPWLALLFAGLTIPVAIANKCMDKTYERTSEERRPLNGLFRYVHNVSMDIGYGKDVRIFGFGKPLMEIAQDGIEKFKQVLGRMLFVERVTAGNVEYLCTLIRTLISYGYLVYAVVNRQITVAEFSLYIGAINGFTTWVTGIVQTYAGIRSYAIEAAPAMEFMNMQDERNRGEGPAVPHTPVEIRFENVRFRYPGAEQDTIPPMNLTIRAGEKLAIVGLNGAGKTTIIKLLTGMYVPTEGRILVDGVDMTRFNRDEYYGMFSAVFQNYLIFPASVGKNVALETDYDKERVASALKQAGIYDKVMSLKHGMDTPLCRDVHDDAVELSGGQMQKLLLARAIYKDSPVMVLDEPTAALDPIAENEMYLAYDRLTKGKTSLYVSHRLASTRFCDRILLLENGRIIEEGTHDELIQKEGAYARLFAMQSKYYQEGGDPNEAGL